MEAVQIDGQNQYDRISQNDFEDTDSIDDPPKIPYPKRIFLLLINVVCDRFTFYGMAAILSLYLNEKLGYSEDDASALYHGFIMMIYAMCIIGGIISDVWLGRFKTILYFSMVHALGCVVVTISAVPNIGISPKTVLIPGLLLIIIGSGITRPSGYAFGGDQFKLPEQAAQLATFFSLTYFASNFGSVMSITLAPILRSDVHCFGDSSCYSLAFGVIAVSMIAAIAFFVIGKSSYTIFKISSENLIVKVTMCISNAISTKIRDGHRSPRKNLLDYSVDKHGEQLVEDIRSLLRILVLYMPVPMFWALFEQQGSRWIFQAKQMNGDIGFFIIQPDQIQMINPLLVLIMIPLFEIVVYPIFRQCGLRRPLQKMVTGGVLAAASFVVAALVQFQIEATPKNTVHMLWLLPQYIFLTAGEILFSTVGYQFTYEEAPETMKSIVSSLWSLTMAIGNLITLVLVSSVRIFVNQSHEFLFFAGLMFVDMLIFGILAYFYKSRVRSEKEQLE